MENRSMKKRKVEASFQSQPHLPGEIMMEILSRLPLKFFSRYRIVCKEWYNFIYNPLFINLHLSRINQNNSDFLVFYHQDRYTPKFYLADNTMLETSSLKNATDICLCDLPSKIKLVGSSNGLMCFCSSPDLETFYICNPVIGESLKLPKVDSRVTTVLPFGKAPVGFGYDASSKTYKVVHTWYFEDQTGVEIYTLGTNKWRRTKNISTHITQESSQVILNGALHWAIYEAQQFPCSYRIGALDIATEVFRTFKAPAKKFETRIRSLGLLRGCLSMVDFIGTLTLSISVWIMKDYGAKSWSIEHQIKEDNLPLLLDPPLSFGAFRIVSDTNMLVLGHREKGHYNLVRKEFKKLEIKVIPSWADCVDVVAHVGSFISPRSIYGRDKVEESAPTT